MYSNQPSFSTIIQSQKISNDNLMDTVSEMRWNKDILVTSAWDGFLRFYQVQLSTGYRPSISLDFKTAIDCQEPVLSVSWKRDMSMVFAALSDNTVRAYDVKTQQSAVIGIHDDCPARQVFWNDDLNVLISLGLDKKIKFWSLQAGGTKPTPSFVIDLSHVPTVGEQSANEQFFAFADVDNKFRWLNWSVIRGNQNSQTQRSYFNMEDNQLIGQISSVAVNENASQLAYGSVDGRAIVKTISSRNELSTKLQFKCYKVEEEARIGPYSKTEKINKMYMCNTIQFNVRAPNWLGTCGSDGTLAFWDVTRKGKILGLKQDAPMVAGQVSPDGYLMAYATGYDWGQGLDRLGEFPSRVGVAYIEDKLLSSL